MYITVKAMILVLAVLCSSAIGQSTVVLPPGKGVEITLQRAAEPSVIVLSETEMHGFWTESVDRAGGGSDMPEGQRPKVDFMARLVDGKAELKVSIFLGTPARGTETPVAVYRISEGETVAISELTKYGYAAPRARLVSVPPALARTPKVRSVTRTLQPEMTATTVPFAAFNLAFRNVSAKPISGIAYQMTTEGLTYPPAFLNVNHGNPLIEPGATQERPMIIRAENTRNGTLIISVDAVFYQDGTYEGDTQLAASYLFGQLVRRDALSRMNNIFSESISRFPARVDVRKVIDAVEAATRSTSDSVLTRITTLFPAYVCRAEEFEPRAKVIRDPVRAEAIAVLKNLEKAAVGRSDEDVNKAFTRLAAHFNDWMQRLPS